MDTPPPEDAERIHMRFPLHVLAALRKAGTRNRRSRTAQVLFYVEQGLRADGFLLGGGGS